jgi:cytochrome b
MAGDRVSFPLWDLPTRCFHWCIVCCLPLAWWSAESDNYDAHAWIGYTVLTLVTTRIVWGLIGSRHARFSDFLVGPHRLLLYLRGGSHGSAGHNPLGGWSVIALLLLLLMQAVSGLFNSDDVLFSGPLYYAADSSFRDVMGVVHELAFNSLLALVLVHIVAVLYHQFRKGEKLITAMVRGRAPGREGREPPVAGWLAALVFVLAGVALWLVLSQAPQPTIMW